MKTAVQCHVRWMIRRDMPSVLETENASFEYPWTKYDFTSRMGQTSCIGMVAERCEHVVGHMVYELHRNRIHLLSFAVHPDHRRHGIGRAMIQKLIGKLSFSRRNRIVAEVRETNLDAQLFLREMGFLCRDILPDYYTANDHHENAYLMIYRHRGD